MIAGVWGLDLVIAGEGSGMWGLEVVEWYVPGGGGGACAGGVGTWGCPFGFAPVPSMIPGLMSHFLHFFIIVTCKGLV